MTNRIAAFTVAVALIVLPSGADGATSMTMVTVREVFGSMLPVTVHTTGLPAQAPPPVTEPDTKLVLVGVGSVSTTPVASDGPALAITAV